MTEPKDVPALTGLRALAVGLVFLHHHGPSHPALQDPDVLSLVRQGHAGVAVFFVLSGFLIAHRYHDVAGSDVLRYLARRAWRILPLYWLLTALTFAWPLLQGEATTGLTWTQLFAHATLTRGWFQEWWSTGIAQAWSLTPEAAFYLLAPLLFRLMRRVPYALVTIPSVLLVVGVLLVEACAGAAPAGFMASYPFLMGATFLGRSFEFMVGVALAKAMRDRSPGTTLRFPTALGGIAVAGILFCGARLGVDYDDVLGVLLLNICLPLAIGLLLFGLLTERTLLQSVLGAGVMVELGNASYAFFLLHMGAPFNALLAFSSSFLMAACAILAASWLLYRFVEEPCTRYGRRVFALRHVKSATARGST